MNSSSPLVGAPLGRTMLRLAVPGVIGALFFSGLGLVEAAFLRHAGVDALAAVAVVFPLIILAAMFSAGAIGGAVSGLTARSLGSGNHQEASSVLVCAVLISLVGGSLMWALMALFGSSLYARASDSAAVSSAAMHYAAIVFPAMPVFWLVNMLCSVLRGSGDMVRPAVVAAMMLISYILLALWLLPEDSSDLKHTIRSAALAMVGAYVSSLCLSLWFVLEPRQIIRFRLCSFRWDTLLKILRQGLLASSQSLMTVIYALVTTLLLGRFGTDWLAGFGLAVRLELMMVPVIFGIGASLIAIVGAYVGAGLRQQAISIAWRGIAINAGLVGCVGLLFSMFPGVWCHSVGSDDIVIEHCRQSLRVLAPSYVFFALGLGGYFASQGLNTLKYPVIGALIRLLIVSSGLLWVSASTPVPAVLALVFSAMVAYGLVVVAGLKFRAWR